MVVTDNGPAMKSVAVARWFARGATWPTCAPATAPRGPTVLSNAGYESLNWYEHLYRHDIASGIDLADHVDAFTDTYNTIRPHQTLDPEAAPRRLPRSPNTPTEPTEN